MFNYDNFTDYSDDLVIRNTTKAMIKEQVEEAYLTDVISSDMKLYAIDILMKRK